MSERGQRRQQDGGKPPGKARPLKRAGQRETRREAGRPSRPDSRPDAGRESRPRGAGLPALDAELKAELESIARAAGCELVHAEWKGNTLRIFIDREGPGPAGQAEQAAGGSDSAEAGVSLGDCELVSRQVSALLDVVDFGKGRYFLEVSSPGLDRELYGPRDYARFVGKLARVTVEEPGARKRTVVGRLEAFHPEPAPGRIELAEEGKGEVLTIALDTIKTARLEIELG
jgi:ribosome maturation factor RimP